MESGENMDPLRPKSGFAAAVPAGENAQGIERKYRRLYRQVKPRN
jgi:hypothetical protein